MKQLVYERLTIDTKRVNIDLKFQSRLTIVYDKSGMGKSFIANIILDHAKNNVTFKNISYINSDYDIAGNIILNSLKSAKSRFIIIDRADILLDKDTRNFILFDANNQYMLYGRGLDDLVYSSS